MPEKTRKLFLNLKDSRFLGVYLALNIFKFGFNLFRVFSKLLLFFSPLRNARS